VDRIAQREKKTGSYLRWILATLLVLAIGCGEEQPNYGEEQTTTANIFTTDSLDYVAFGDSLATGYGVTYGYVYRYAAVLGMDTGAEVNVNDLGMDGLTSAQLRAAVENEQGARDAIEQSDVVTINIGANDLMQARLRYKAGYCGGADNQDCLRQTVADFRANWDAILTIVTGLRSPDEAIIRVTDFYNPFVNLDGSMISWPDSDTTDFSVFEKYLEQVNSDIAESSNAHGIPLAKIHEAFNGPSGTDAPSDKGYMHSDGIHPNDGGHAVIAQELRRLGYEPLFR
jgi:lysophospholipase L1-like esterase